MSKQTISVRRFTGAEMDANGEIVEFEIETTESSAVTLRMESEVLDSALGPILQLVANGHDKRRDINRSIAGKTKFIYDTTFKVGIGRIYRQPDSTELIFDIHFYQNEQRMAYGISLRATLADLQNLCRAIAAPLGRQA